jgi:hypothetical protein
MAGTNINVTINDLSGSSVQDLQKILVSAVLPLHEQYRHPFSAHPLEEKI